jgi:hypothetical protein
VLKWGTPYTSILLVVERGTPGTSILLAEEGGTPCTSMLLVLVVVKGIPIARSNCRQWEKYTLLVHTAADGVILAYKMLKNHK